MPNPKRAYQIHELPTSKHQRRNPFPDHAHLARTPGLETARAGHKLGMSVGGLSYCLHALIDKGSLKMVNFSKSKNKFKYVHLFIRTGIAEKVVRATRFLKCKMAEYHARKVEADAQKAEVGEDQGCDQKVFTA